MERGGALDTCKWVSLLSWLGDKDGLRGTRGESNSQGRTARAPDP